VTNAPYLTWSDLLCYCGARSRTRQEAVDPIAGRVRRMNEVLRDHIQAAIEYARIVGNQDVSKLQQMADQSVVKIFEKLKEEHEHKR